MAKTTGSAANEPWRRAVETAVESDPEGPLGRLAPLLKGELDYGRAAGLLDAVYGEAHVRDDGRTGYYRITVVPPDPRWNDVALGFLTVADPKLREAAIGLLQVTEPDRRVVEPLVALEPELQFGPFGGRLCVKVVRVLARVPDSRSVSILAKAALEGGDATDEAREALFEIEDPAAVGALQAYVTKYEPWTNWKAKVDRARHALESLLTKVGAEGKRAASRAKSEGREAAKAVKKQLSATRPLPAEPRPEVGKSEPLALEPIEAQRKRLRTKLKGAGLSGHEALLVRPAVVLSTERVDEDEIPVGATKIGGMPDLPRGEGWPEHKGYVLSFVAQVRLEDVAALKLELPLPAQGMLAFFVLDESSSGDYLQRVKVLWFEAPRGVRRVAPPKNFQATRKGIAARQPYAPCRVRLAPTLTLAPSSNPLVDTLSPAERKAYSGMKPVARPLCNQLLGFRHEGYDASNPATARLLLRLTSDSQADMEWGDVDCLDVYVPEKGLKKSDFSKAYPYIGD